MCALYPYTCVRNLLYNYHIQKLSAKNLVLQFMERFTLLVITLVIMLSTAVLMDTAS